jgi:hypothetical protein
MADDPNEQKSQQVAPRPVLAAGGRVMPIVPTTLEDAYRMAKAIAAANMAPVSYERNAERVLIGILHGMEVGLTPMAALQSIAVINGMPSIWGDGMLGLVRASGLLDSISETSEGDGAARVAICRVKRRGEDMVERRFSYLDAEQAGLIVKPGPWKAYPQRMMQMRARAWALRDAFADVLRGLHGAEEAQDMGDLVDMGDGVMEARPRRADYATADPPDMDRAYRQAMGEPVPVEPEEVEVVDADTGEVTTQARPASAPAPTPKPEPKSAPEPAPAPSSVDDLDGDATNVYLNPPLLLATRELPDGKIDWKSWRDEAMDLISRCPSADWISEWLQVHTTTLSNLRARSVDAHAKFMAFAKETRGRAAAAPTTSEKG